MNGYHQIPIQLYKISNAGCPKKTLQLKLDLCPITLNSNIFSFLRGISSPLYCDLGAPEVIKPPFSAAENQAKSSAPKLQHPLVNENPSKIQKSDSETEELPEKRQKTGKKNRRKRKNKKKINTLSNILWKMLIYVIVFSHANKDH